MLTPFTTYSSLTTASGKSKPPELKVSNIMSFLFQGIANGYVTFVISILFIGACTAVIGDIAGHLGCFINLKDGVNAIAFVALGTSVPGSQMSHVLVQTLC
jgi:hypothetical protein